MKTFANLFLRICVASALVSAVLAICGADLVQADVKLPAIISDHMVLQAGTTIPIWGWAEAGEEVSASIADQTQTTKADADGKWKLAFAKLAAGGPLTLTVKGKNTLRVEDVLVGEVWLASGQSNMAMNVGSARDANEEKAAADLPQLRVFQVKQNPQPKPQAECAGSWEVCSPATVSGFSATAYFFGRDLYRELHTPVGLIQSASGGTAVEAWTSYEAQAKLPEYATISAEWTKSDALPWDEDQAKAEFRTRQDKWREAAKAAKAAGQPVRGAPRPIVQSTMDKNHPANLYNGMIAPLIPYAIRGAIWYQGERNSNEPFANLYGLQLATLIKDWRTRWGYDFPFAWVQLPDYRAPQQAPSETSGWATIREQMLRTLAVPHTGMAIALGLGEEKNIHPKNKQVVGARLAQWALVDVYGRSGTSSGPLPAGHQTSGSEIIVKFKHAAGGLKFKDGKAQGFAIAGADQKFVWADARIDGDRVIVSSPEVPQPKAVRYAWANNPVWSLENSAGVPASPFRTDDWNQ